jgi:hypothetical protein
MNDGKNFLSTKLFDETTIADLVKLTYDRNVSINNTITEFLDQIKNSNMQPSDLIALLPIIKDYLNTANQSDGTLVKLIATLSKYIVDPAVGSTGVSNEESIPLTDEDRELFARVDRLMKEDMNNG